MEISKVIKDRRSIRKFKSDEVSEEIINDLIDAARLAPSGSNKQPVRYAIIKSEEKREELAKLPIMAFVPKAPIILACCVDKLAYRLPNSRHDHDLNMRSMELTEQEKAMSEYNRKRSEWDESTLMAYLFLNAGISLEHIVLKAVDLGLGSCWVRMFDAAKVKELLGLEERYEVVALLPVGYPDEEPEERPRISLDEVVLSRV